MHTLDIIILGIIGVFALWGMLAGLVGQLSLVMSGLCGFGSWYFFSGWFSEKTAGWFEQEWLGSAFASVMTFLTGAILVRMALSLSRKYLEGDRLKSLNRFLGLIFGIFKGTLLAALVVFFVFKYGKKDLVEKAWLAPELAKVCQWAQQKFDLGGYTQKSSDWTKGKIKDAVIENISTEGIYEKIKSWSADTAEQVINMGGETPPQKPETQDEAPGVNQQKPLEDTGE